MSSPATARAGRLSERSKYVGSLALLLVALCVALGGILTVIWFLGSLDLSLPAYFATLRGDLDDRGVFSGDAHFPGGYVSGIVLCAGAGTAGLMFILSAILESVAASLAVAHTSAPRRAGADRGGGTN